jgi:hypothetical protein
LNRCKRLVFEERRALEELGAARQKRKEWTSSKAAGAEDQRGLKRILSNG